VLQEAALAVLVVTLAVDVILKIENPRSVSWETLGGDVFDLATVGVLNKADNMVNAAEGASDAEIGFKSWFVSTNPSSALETSETYLENFPARLVTESKTLTYLGGFNSAISLADENSQFIHQTLSTFKTLISRNPLVVSIPVQP